MAERGRRLRFFLMAIDLIKNTRCDPITKINPSNHSELLHRFTGLTHQNEIFAVQIKEEIKSGNKWFMSVFCVKT